MTIEDVLKLATDKAGDLRRDSFCKLIDLVRQRKAMHIVETGTYRGCEGDGMSTLILSALALATHSYFASLEINPENIVSAKSMLSAHNRFADFICGDSVATLSMFPNFRQIVVLYLDSYDYDPKNPLPAQMHQLAELGAAYGKLSADAVVLLDDCNMEGGGKGLLADQFLKERGWKLVHDGYQKLFSRV